jgi:hypothetical protein
MDLPPLATGNGQEWSGFALSCKQARVELTEAAARHTKAFLTTFKKEYKQDTGFDLDISGIDATKGMTGLKEITVAAPTTLLQEYAQKPVIDHGRSTLMSFEDPDFRPDTKIICLKPLLEKRFNKVIVSLRGSPASAIDGKKMDGEEKTRQFMERAEITIQTIIISITNIALLASLREDFNLPQN